MIFSRSFAVAIPLNPYGKFSVLSVLHCKDFGNFTELDVVLLAVS